MPTSLQIPHRRPANPNFSSGPCAKRPGWTTDILKSAVVGRSHRSKAGLAKLREVIELTRTVLGIPDDYKVAIVPGSDTGAVEMALWSLLDVTTWSWQKVLGGEAAHGMLVLAPRAIERLESYDPPWGLPKLFRMKDGGRVNNALFSILTLGDRFRSDIYRSDIYWREADAPGKGLGEATGATEFDYLIGQNGMFSLVKLSPAAIGAARLRYGACMVHDGPINIADLPLARIPDFANAISAIPRPRDWGKA